MKLFLLKSIIVVVALFFAVGFAYDYWVKLYGRPTKTMHLVLPDSKRDIEVFATNLSDNNYDKKDSIFKFIFRENKFTVLASMLDSSETMNEKGVGFGGIYTWQYACYERLKQVASTRELIYLTKHRNPVIRVYAYKALIGVDSVEAKVARKRLLNDTATFDYFSGCMMTQEQVKDFALYHSKD